MLEELLEILKNSEADDYEVTQSVSTGWEFYFIKHKLDQNRATKVEEVKVKVYKKIDDGQYLGFAVGDIAPTAGREEMEKAVKDLVYQASLVKNRPYALQVPKEAEEIEVRIPDASDEAEKFITAFNEIPETDTEYLNSYEIFSKVTTKRYITSTGIDVTETYPSSTLDVVVNAKNDEHEIELYRFYKLGACDKAHVCREIEDTLRFGRDRLNAVNTPVLKECPVVFSTDAALQIYDYFLGNLNTALVVRRMSTFEIGKPIAEEIKGDKVTIETRRVLENSDRNFRYDAEGSVVRDEVLMEADVPKAYWGGRMFSQYLGLDDTFSLTNYAVSGGTKSEEEIRSGKYLEIVEFSDFQVNDMTGDIFGEIRLAYYHDGDQCTVVSGGSVSGDLKEALKEMYMSNTSRQFNNALIPSLTRLEKVTISGIEE